MSRRDGDDQRVIELIREAFQGVTLGEGVGLRQGQGLDEYADSRTLAMYREQDEKQDWSAIPVADLDQHGDSLSYFDGEGMRFHLPAYLIAELEGRLKLADVVFHLCYTDGAQSRYGLLSSAQRNAVREFLLLRLAAPANEVEHPLIEQALSHYWMAQTEA